MSTFPVILERSCRDRAVTQQQMLSFRKAWSGVTSLMVVDPTILPTSNNVKTLPFEMLKDAFPSMTWDQLRNNRRAVLITSGYMTPRFAEELSAYLGCPAEKGIYPADFLEEAKRPPPVYFETDDVTLQGLCCVCYKKGVLGRCPNAGCGLLMHHTCVPSAKPGAAQVCSICRDEIMLQEEAKDLPFWHEAEVGAKSSRFKKP